MYIKNLPPEADKLFLYQRFAPHGAIQSVKVLTDEDSQQCKGVGFVNYVVPTGAMLAVQVSNASQTALLRLGPADKFEDDKANSGLCWTVVICWPCHLLAMPCSTLVAFTAMMIA